MADRRVTAEWAWIGKKPDTVAYGILASSAGDGGLDEYVGHYVTGAPDPGTQPDAPGAPPWVTFGPFVTTAGEALISVSIQDPWRDRDRSRRPISPQRLFLVPYTDLAAIGASYQQLWAALRDAELPTADCVPLTVEVDQQPIDDLVATLERYGIERLTTLAAMILEDRLVLADSAALPRSERLAVLDAAAALLPYGFRAAMSASSAVDNKVTHVMDLVFAEFANETNKQVMVQLSDGAPVPAPKTKLGRAYQDMLREKARTPGLRAVVKHLWAATEPCSLKGRQGVALEILTELDFDDSLRRALHDGTANRAQVLTYFRRDIGSIGSSWRSHTMTEPMRRLALRLVLDGPEAEATSMLVPHWGTVADDLFSAATAALDAGEPTVARWCLHAARLVSPDDEDQFTAGLLASENAAASHRPQRLAALAGLLSSGDGPRPGSLPRARRQTWRDRDKAWPFGLFRKLLAAEAEPGGDIRGAMAWASWLCLPPSDSRGGPPPWVVALSLACHADLRAIAGTVLDADDPIWAGVLLRLAGHCGRLPQMLSVVHNDLLEVASSGAAGPAQRQHAAHNQATRYLLAALDVDLWHVGSSPNIVAVADITRVLLGGRPHDFPANSDEPTLDGYLDGLRYVLDLNLPGQWRSWLVKQFLRCVIPGKPGEPLTYGAVRLLNNWSAEPGLHADVAGYIATMDDEQRPSFDERLAPSYWTSLAVEPGLTGYATVPRLTAAVREALAAPQAALTRRIVQGGITSTALARTCYDARQAGLPVVEILRVLGRAGADRLDPRRVDDVLREFQGLMHYDLQLGRDAEVELFKCYEVIARGQFGNQFAGAFARELTARCQTDIRLRENLIRRIAGSQGLWRPAVQREERRHRWFRLPRFGRGG